MGRKTYFRCMDLSYKNNLRKILHKKKFLFDNKIYPNNFLGFSFIPTIKYSPKKYLKLRNQKYILKNSKIKKKISLKNHQVFIKKYFLLPRLDYLLINNKNNEILCGVGIKLTKYGFEINKFVSKKHQKKGLAKKSIIKMINFFNKQFGKKTLISLTKVDNYRNIFLNLSIGFKITKVESNFIIMEKK